MSKVPTPALLSHYFPEGGTSAFGGSGFAQRKSQKKTFAAIRNSVSTAKAIAQVPASPTRALAMTSVAEGGDRMQKAFITPFGPGRRAAGGTNLKNITTDTQFLSPDLRTPVDAGDAARASSPFTSPGRKKAPTFDNRIALSPKGEQFDSPHKASHRTAFAARLDNEYFSVGKGANRNKVVDHPNHFRLARRMNYSYRFKGAKSQTLESTVFDPPKQQRAPPPCGQFLHHTDPFDEKRKCTTFSTRGRRSIASPRAGRGASSRSSDPGLRLEDSTSSACDTTQLRRLNTTYRPNDTLSVMGGGAGKDSSSIVRHNRRAVHPFARSSSVGEVVNAWPLCNAEYARLHPSQTSRGCTSSRHAAGGAPNSSPGLCMIWQRELGRGPVSEGPCDGEWTVKQQGRRGIRPRCHLSGGAALHDLPTARPSSRSQTPCPFATDFDTGPETSRSRHRRRSVSGFAQRQHHYSARSRSVSAYLRRSSSSGPAPAPFATDFDAAGSAIMATTMMNRTM